MSEENTAAVEAEATPEVSPEITESDPTSTADAIGDVVDDIASSPEEQAEIAEVQEELKRMFSAKISGEDREFDLDDEGALDEIRKLVSMGGGAQKSMQESAELRKDVDSFMSDLQNNTASTLAEMGIDVNDFAEAILNQQIEEMEKSPEQREKEATMSELEQLRKELDSERQSKEEADYQRQVEQYEIQLDREISEALDSDPSLPKSDYVYKRVGEAMLWADDNGFEVSAADVIPLVKDELQKEMSEFMDVLPVEFIENFIGGNAMEKLRKQRLSRMDKKDFDTVSSTKDTAINTDNAPVSNKKKINMKDFLRGK